MIEKNVLGITRKEWHYLLISIFFLILPILFFHVLLCIPAGFSMWIMGFIVLFFLVVWFAVVLCILLYSTKSMREQDREMELVKSIEKYLIKVLEDVEWTDDTVNMVIDSLYDWTRLPEEEKYERY
jgi:membrane protein implicated in regulation of membrane protease activity